MCLKIIRHCDDDWVSYSLCNIRSVWRCFKDWIIKGNNNYFTTCICRNCRSSNWL